MEHYQELTSSPDHTSLEKACIIRRYIVAAGHPVQAYVANAQIDYSNWTPELKAQIMTTTGAKQWTNNTNMCRLSCMPLNFLIHARLADSQHQECKSTLLLRCVHTV